MQPNYARTSLLLFGISTLLLIVLTLFESALAGLPQSLERVITFLALVLPAGVGAVFGWLSLTRREGKNWMALSGLIFNTLFALFHLAILSFAG